jgi:hypothetical protein
VTSIRTRASSAALLLVAAACAPSKDDVTAPGSTTTPTADADGPSPLPVLFHGFAGVYDEFAANTGQSAGSADAGVTLLILAGYSAGAGFAGMFACESELQLAGIVMNAAVFPKAA